MTDHNEHLIETEQLVRGNLVRVARQASLVEELERLGHRREAREAKALLRTFEDTLTLSREHLQRERDSHH